MPIRSQAQFLRLVDMAHRGEIKHSQVKQMIMETVDPMNIPTKIGTKLKSKLKTKKP